MEQETAAAEAAAVAQRESPGGAAAAMADVSDQVSEARLVVHHMYGGEACRVL